MDETNETNSIDFATRFRRSRGRSGRTFSATAKVTREEHDELEAAAKAEGKALGEWSREALLASARRTVASPVFTEVIATRRLLNSVLRVVACGEHDTGCFQCGGARDSDERSTKQPKRCCSSTRDRAEEYHSEPAADLKSLSPKRVVAGCLRPSIQASISASRQPTDPAPSATWRGKSTLRNPGIDGAARQADTQKDRGKTKDAGAHKFSLGHGMLQLCASGHPPARDPSSRVRLSTFSCRR